MMRRWAPIFAWLLLSPQLLLASTTDVTEDFPELKKFLFVEPKTGFRLGIGLNPIGVTRSKLFMGLNIFEFHWMNDLWDLELLTAQIGFGSARSSVASSKHFTFKTSPRFRLFKFLAVGPLLGYEFVSFPDVGAALNKGALLSPYEPLSTRGSIYGFALSETVSIHENYRISLHQSIYWQTYSVKETVDGWTFVFDNPEIQSDPEREQIKGGMVFLLGVSVLF